jgi:hypothetical protein
MIVRWKLKFVEGEAGPHVSLSYQLGAVEPAMTIFNNVGAMQDLPTYTVLINSGSAPNYFVHPMDVLFMLWIVLWVVCNFEFSLKY